MSKPPGSPCRKGMLKLPNGPVSKLGSANGSGKLKLNAPGSKPRLNWPGSNPKLKSGKLNDGQSKFRLKSPGFHQFVSNPPPPRLNCPGSHQSAMLEIGRASCRER